MEQAVLNSFLLSVPQAAAIWLIILVVAVVAATALTLPDRARAAATPEPPDDGSAAEERAWADRYAEEITVAADRAAATARRGRAEWERAQQELDRAWEAFEAADRAARRIAAAAAFPAPDAGHLTPADRERSLHRAATAACRRRELGVRELNDILAHRDGWDPRLHPVEQEVALHRLVRERALTAYREAAARERQAWHTAEVAAAALASLREEARAARLRVGERTAGQLWWAEQWATEPADATIVLPTPTPAAPAAPAALYLPTVPLPTVTLRTASAPVRSPGAVPPSVTSVEERSPTVPPSDATVPLPEVTVPGPTRPARVVPVVPVQAGAPAAESLRQPLAAVGADGPGR